MFFVRITYFFSTSQIIRTSHLRFSRW